ncbi:phosphatase PAP2 family protein [Staphylococcus petrasii]|uniref:phosphatase PAP2 family protein n=1 Tax=Staphylococcus petrasii TaxID=1276936 RepID=UPI003F66FBC6
MNYQGKWFNDYMTTVATYGDIVTFVILTIIIAIIVFFKRHFILSLWLLLTVASGGIVGILLKDVLHRARPYDHLSIDAGFSFPSGHSLASTLVIMIIVLFFIPKIHSQLLKWSLTSVLIIAWISILFSRLYFHAHYLTDVLGGVTFSLSWGFDFMILYQRFAVKLNQLNIFRKNKNYHVSNL